MTQHKTEPPIFNNMSRYAAELDSALANAKLDDDLLAKALAVAARLDAEAARGPAGPARAPCEPCEPHLNFWQRAAIRALRPAARAYEGRRGLGGEPDAAPHAPSRARYLVGEVARALRGDLEREARRPRGSMQSPCQGCDVVHHLSRAWYSAELPGLEPFIHAVAAEFAVQAYIESELELLAQED